MRESRSSLLVALAVVLVGPARATETCATETPQPNVRRHLVHEAAKLFAPEAVEPKSVYFCAHQGLDAEAVIDAVPRRLPDGSDLVRQAACERREAVSRARWRCQLFEHRKTDTIVKIDDAPWRFTVNLTPEASPELARQLVEEAAKSSFLVSTQNYCESPPKGAVETFRADFLRKPSTSENPTFYLDLHGAVWQVIRRYSSVSLFVSESGTPQFKCWTVWDEL